MSNSLDSDQARRFVGPDLGPNCLQRLSADDTRQRVFGHSECRTVIMFPNACDLRNVGASTNYSKEKVFVLKVRFLPISRVSIFWILSEFTHCMMGNLACFLSSEFFLKIVLQKNSGIPLLCQTIWIQIRNDVLLGLNWIQTVCNG